MSARLPYRDRADAGRMLAAELSHWRGAERLLVLGLPRGGVPVAAEVARALRVLSPLPGLQVDPAAVERVALAEQAELARRETLYRGGRPPLDLQGRSIVVVDDGLATGASLQVAVLAIRSAQPLRLCAAVPVGSSEGCELVREAVDELVCPAIPVPFRAVSLWYRDFPQTSDSEVRELLAQSGGRTRGSGLGPPGSSA